MSRFTAFLALLVAALSSVSAFTVPKSAFVRSTRLYETGLEESPTVKKFVERGVSVDQDGKSNVWAIEPKMEVDTKSSEEKTQGFLIGGAALAAFGVAAGVILSNLPDPNQF